MVLAAAAWWGFHGLATASIRGPASDLSRVADALLIPFTIAWVLLVVHLMRRSSLSVQQAALYAALVGGADGVLLTIGAVGADASRLLSFGAGLVSAGLGFLSVSGWLIWWHHRGGRGRLLAGPSVSPSMFLKLLLIGGALALILGIVLSHFFPGPIPAGE